MNVRNPDPTRSQIRGSGLLLSGQIFGGVVNLVAQVLIVRYLTKENFGAFAYALSVALVGGTVADFAMRRGMSRFLPLYEERGQLPEAAGTLVFGVGMVTSLGLATVLFIVGFRGELSGSFANDPTATTLLVLLALLAPVGALSTLLDGVFAVFARPRAITLRKFVLMPLARLAAVGLLVGAGQGVVFLAAAYVVTGILGLVALGPLLIRVLRQHDLLQHLRPGRFVMPIRDVLRFTFPLLTTDIASVLLLAGSTVVLGLMSTPNEVALLRAVLPITLTMGYVPSSFGLLLAPLAARLYAHEDAVELNRLYWRTAIWTAVLAFPIFIVCIGLAEPVTVLLFGQAYKAAAPVLALLVIGQFFNAATGANEIILSVFGKVRFIAAMNLLAIVVAGLLMLLLIPAHGAIGAAVATSVTLLLMNGIGQIGLDRLTTVRGADRRALVPYLAIVGSTVIVVAAELFKLPLLVNILLVAAAIVTVFGISRNHLELAESFPELAGLPLIGRLAGAPKTRA